MLTQGFLTQKGLTSLNLSIFIINNFYCVISCLNMNRVTTCRVKYLDIILPTSFFRHNSEEKSTKFLNLKMTLNKIGTSFPSTSPLTKCFGNFEKMDTF